jgi:hypothetical protein
VAQYRLLGWDFANKVTRFSATIKKLENLKNYQLLTENISWNQSMNICCFLVITIYCPYDISSNNPPFTGTSLAVKRRTRVTQKCSQSQCCSFSKGLETVTTLYRCNEK